MVAVVVVVVVAAAATTTTTSAVRPLVVEAAVAAAAVAAHPLAAAVEAAVAARLPAAAHPRVVAAMRTLTTAAAATTTSRSERMLASLTPARRLALASACALVVSLGCTNKKQAAERANASALAVRPDLPEPRGVLGELTLLHPGASFAAFRDLGGIASALLPAGFPMFVATAFGLPPLSADSFDPELPVFGALLQGDHAEPGWVLAVHAVSGPELVAKLSTGDHAPFRAAAGGSVGLTLLQSNMDAGSVAQAARSLAVFDNYLLVASSAEALLAAGPYAARMLPKHALPQVPISVRFSKQALSSHVVPALRGLWASYRTNLSHLDQDERSAHGGRAPDFGDPAQVILGADTVVESALALIDGATALELDLAPYPNRLEATLLLQPDEGSDAHTRLTTLAGGSAKPLLSLPAETQFALGISRASAEREAAGKAAGDDWVRLLGARLSAAGATQLRAVLSDWELGRGVQSSYGFLGGSDPGAYLVTEVADGARLKHAGQGLFALLSVPGVRAPLSEFLGDPHVTEGMPAKSEALANVSRKQLTFTPNAARKTTVPPLSFAWLVTDQAGYAAAGKSADPVLKKVVDSARGQGDTLASKAGIAEGVQRIGDQAAVFAYADARLAAPAAAGPSLPAPLLLSLGKRGSAGYLQLEVSKPAIDLALRSALGF